MPAKTKDVVPVEPGVLEARRELARRIASITGGAGEHVTAVPGIVLYHRDEPTRCYRASYEPSLSIFVQGRKHVILGETEYVCDSGSFLLSSIDVPAKSQIVEASEKTPLLVMFLRFDMPRVREMLCSRRPARGQSRPSSTRSGRRRDYSRTAQRLQSAARSPGYSRRHSFP